MAISAVLPLEVAGPTSRSRKNNEAGCAYP